MSNFHVLLIDGDAEHRLTAESVFAGLGCRVTAAAAASSALAALAAHRFDLICLDPHDPSADRILPRLAPGQYAVAWRGDAARLPARLDGVLARPLTPLLASITVVMAKMAAAKARAQGPERSAAA